MEQLKKSVAKPSAQNGPCESSIEPALQQHGIQRQSCQGGGGGFCGKWEEVQEADDQGRRQEADEKR